MRLNQIIREAVAIRQDLRARRKRASNRAQAPQDLGGVCSLASVLLCIATGDDTLRSLRGTDHHTWNIFDGTIIDITATQFIEPGFFLREDLGNLVDGVYVSPKRQDFHTAAYGDGPRVRIGRAQLEYMVLDGWYVEPRHGATRSEIRRFNACVEQFLNPKQLEELAA